MNTVSNPIDNAKRVSRLPRALLPRSMGDCLRSLSSLSGVGGFFFQLAAAASLGAEHRLTVAVARSTVNPFQYGQGRNSKRGGGCPLVSIHRAPSLGCYSSLRAIKHGWNARWVPNLTQISSNLQVVL